MFIIRLIISSALLLSAAIADDFDGVSLPEGSVSALPARVHAGGNPYLDGEVQSFVENNYGYMKPRPAQAQAESPAASVAADDLRDSMRSISFAPELEKAAREVDSWLSSPSNSEETAALKALNTQAFCQLDYSFDSLGPKSGLGGEDFAIRSISEAGPMASPVPPLGYKGCECVPLHFWFAVLGLNPGTAGVREKISRVSEETGFKPYFGDLNAGRVLDDGTIIVRGWVPSGNYGKLSGYGFVRGVKTGPDAREYAARLYSLKLDVLITLKLPSGSVPELFLQTVLRRLNESVGFSWDRTVSVKKMPLADSGRTGSSAYMVSVLGRIPIEMLKKTVEYPFVTRIEPAGVTAGNY